MTGVTWRVANRGYVRLLFGNDVPRELTADAITAAFRRAVMADHPDHGGAGMQIDALRRARDVLMRQVAAPAVLPCPQCAGSGTVGWRRCAACDGTGDRTP